MRAPAHSQQPAHFLLLTTAATTLHAACCRRSYLQRRRDRQGAAFTYEVIIVDDGSRDGTVRAAAEFVRKHGFDAVRVLRLPANRGKGYAGAEGVWWGEACCCWRYQRRPCCSPVHAVSLLPQCCAPLTCLFRRPTAALPP